MALLARTNKESIKIFISTRKIDMLSVTGMYFSAEEQKLILDVII